MVGPMRWKFDAVGQGAQNGVAAKYAVLHSMARVVMFAKHLAWLIADT